MSLSRRQFFAVPPLLLTPLALGSIAIAGRAQASAIRIEVNRKNLDKVGLKLTLGGGEVREQIAHFRLAMPEKQPKLAHLWRVELWLKQPHDKPYKTRVVALDKQRGNLVGGFAVPVKAKPTALLAIRTGRHAPLAETIYQLDISSFTG